MDAPDTAADRTLAALPAGYGVGAILAEPPTPPGTRWRLLVAGCPHGVHRLLGEAEACAARVRAAGPCATPPSGLR